MSRDELRAAVEAVVAAGRAVTADSVRERLAVAGRRRSLSTVHHDLASEARRPDTWLMRVKRGYYGVGAPAAAALPAHEASGHVLDAFGALAASGETTPSVRQLRQQLADRGVRYSERAVYVGLEKVRALPAPLVVKLGPGRWSLTDAGRGAWPNPDDVGRR